MSIYSRKGNRSPIRGIKDGEIFDDDSNEDIEKYIGDEEYVRMEVQRSNDSMTTITVPIVQRWFKTTVRWSNHCIMHQGVPVLACRDPCQQKERFVERLEVGFPIEVVAAFD